MHILPLHDALPILAPPSAITAVAPSKIFGSRGAAPGFHCTSSPEVGERRTSCVMSYPRWRRAVISAPPIRPEPPEITMRGFMLRSLDRRCPLLGVWVYWAQIGRASCRERVWYWRG